jgi:aspartyl/glutamyl-tRNA(Asn/Gln) amidotransferase C subunit
MISFEEVDHLAKLARIQMSDDEKKELQKDLLSILGFIKQIQEVTDKAEPVLLAHRNVMREDKNAHETGLFTDILLGEAPKTKEGYFVVKKIIESKK